MVAPVPPELALALAAIHAEAFEAPWDAAAIAALLASPGVFVEAETGGFILARAVAGEAEILTLAVRPAARRQGLGRRLTEAAAARAARLGAFQMFLEVAEDNAAARALYAGLGFRATGRRRGYYQRTDGSAVDAVIMTRDSPSTLPSAP